ncbi:MAG: translation initiation factor IF-3 [Candidatus Babeliales bacterium]
MNNNKTVKEKNTPEALKYSVNERIRADRIMVIDHEGQSLGVIPKFQALARAEELGLDLVQVGEKDNVPVVKMMDFGKFLYTKKKQLGDAKKHQKVIVVKELKMRPHIGDQDYKTKLNQAEQFFKDGNKVKFTLQFRGREMATAEETGRKFFVRIINDLTTRNIGALAEEKEARGGVLWSKIFYVKGK